MTIRLTLPDDYDDGEALSVLDALISAPSADKATCGTVIGVRLREEEVEYVQ
jgi:hypothetical protein